MKKIGLFLMGTLFLSGISYATVSAGEDGSVSGGGETYTTKLMPDGNQWTSENIRHEASAGNSWCYDNDPANCDEYGRLYDWDAAMTVCEQLGDGWSLPSNDDWGNLETSLGCADSSNDGRRCDGLGWYSGSKLGDLVSMLPGAHYTNGSFQKLDDWGVWWTSTLDGSVPMYKMLATYNEGVVGGESFRLLSGSSVICIKKGEEEKEEESKGISSLIKEIDSLEKELKEKVGKLNPPEKMMYKGFVDNMLENLELEKRDIAWLVEKIEAINKIEVQLKTHSFWSVLDVVFINFKIKTLEILNKKSENEISGIIDTIIGEKKESEVSENPPNMSSEKLSLKEAKELTERVFKKMKEGKKDDNNSDIYTSLFGLEGFEKGLLEIVISRGDYLINNGIKKEHLFNESFERLYIPVKSKYLVEMEELGELLKKELKKNGKTLKNNNLFLPLAIITYVRDLVGNGSKYIPMEEIRNERAEEFAKIAISKAPGNTFVVDLDENKEEENKEEKITTPSEDGYIKDGIVYCEGFDTGKIMEIKGEKYYVAKDKDDAKNNIDKFGGEYSANRVCTSHITDMKSMFFETNFNEDISNWDVSNVTSMSNMFSKNNFFDQDISNWDVSNVENMFVMFYRTRKFNQDISDWDVSNVTTMSNMFDGANRFDQDISNWCVKNIKSEPSAFDRFSGFEGEESKQPNWGKECKGSDTDEGKEDEDKEDKSEVPFIVVKDNYGKSLKDIVIKAEKGMDATEGAFGIIIDGSSYKNGGYYTYEEFMDKFKGDKVNITLERKGYNDIEFDIKLEDGGFKFGDVFSSTHGAVVKRDYNDSLYVEYNDNVLKEYIKIYSREDLEKARDGKVVTIEDEKYDFCGKNNPKTNNCEYTLTDIQLGDNINNLSYLFYDKYFKLDSKEYWKHNNIEHWDTSNVTDMSYMFRGANSFNQDLSGWCVENIKSESNVFNKNWYNGNFVLLKLRIGVEGNYFIS